MVRIAGIIVACLLLAGCNKDKAVASCRLEVAKKWNEGVLKWCIDPSSPFASSNAASPDPMPKCSEVDQAGSFMRLCMKTTGYEPAESCSSLRFEQFDRKCYKAFGINQLFDSIAESDLLSDSSEKPWGGYARLKNGSRLEWVNFYGTYTECTNALKRVTVDDPIIFYTAPTGCAYNGNSYWRVWIMNALWGGSELGCIAVGGDSKEATNIGMLYGPVLGRQSPRPAGSKWHCVNN